MQAVNDRTHDGAEGCEPVHRGRPSTTLLVLAATATISTTTSYVNTTLLIGHHTLDPSAAVPRDTDADATA